MTETQYLPGVCNIGPVEIRRRRLGGWVSLGVTVVALVILAWSDLSPWWRLLVFFPATASAAGFLQARMEFCSGFSRAGVFNFGDLGETERVTDETDRAKDRRRGNQIMLYAALIGAAVALSAALVG